MWSSDLRLPAAALEAKIDAEWRAFKPVYLRWRKERGAEFDAWYAARAEAA